MNEPSFNLTAPIAPGRTRYAPSTIPVVFLVVILAVAVGIINVRPPGNRTSPERTIPAVAFSSAGTPTTSTSLKQACTTPPGDLSRLTLTGPTTTQNVIMPLDLSTQEGSQQIVRISWHDVPTGTPPDSTTITAVTDVMWQYVTCANAGNAAAASALFTDDYWRRAQALQSPIDVENPHSFLSIGSEVRRSNIEPPDIIGIYLLPDGRILAEVRTSSTNQLNFTALVLIKQGGVWRIDEGVVVIKNEQLQVEVDDDGFSPTNLIVTSGKAEIALTNNGTRPHTMVNSKLHLRIEVQPGETAYAVVTYSEATFEFKSDLPLDTDPGFTGTITFAGATTAPCHFEGTCRTANPREATPIPSASPGA